jgi:HAD superfamily hydrolase (TIGR01509 family)
MIKAVIFDMDGLMIDSENLQSRAFRTVLEQYNIQPIPLSNGLIQAAGVNEKSNWELIKKRHNLIELTDVLIKKRNPVILDLMKKFVEPKLGLIKLINLLKEKGLILAVASSTGLGHIKLVLKKLNIEKKFNAVISGQFVKNSKPHPDIYLEVAKKINIKPSECLVLEDSESGVEAGYRAGMKVIAVPNKFTKNHDFSKADLIVKSLKYVNLSMINMLE